MKVIDTLTDNELTVLLGGGTVGIFTTLVLDIDPWNAIKSNLCFSYYINHSRTKTVVSTYKFLTDYAKAHPEENINVNGVIGTSIRSKYVDKWSRVYEALITKTYDPTANYEYTEKKNGNNVDTKIYDNEVADTKTKATDVKTTNANSGKSKLYGFNSDTAVPTDEDETTTTETTVGLASGNVDTGNRKKTGTDSDTFAIDETVTKTGRDTSVSDLIDKELSLRDRYTFYDVIFKDIDNVFALSIYER